MRVRMMTLADLTPVARAATRRNAEPSRMNQGRLREFARALVEAYGYRDDYRWASPPWSVPFVPQPFAGEMLDYFEAQARYWLGRSIPDGAKQPNLIRNRLAEARGIVGSLDSFEDAPAAVAAKAPKLFRPERPAGQPHAKVLKAAATWRLFDALQRLAIHFDVLSGQPTKLEIFGDELAKQAESVGAQVVETVEKVGSAGKDLLKWGAIAAIGLGALFVVTR